MLQDLKWGFGGGFGMTLVACLAAASGLISSVRAMPFIAGGALLILITLIVILSRSGEDTPISAECIPDGAEALIASRMVEKPAFALQQLPPQSTSFREAASDWSSSESADLFQSGQEEGLNGAKRDARQAHFRFCVGSCFAEFLLRIPPHASSSEIAQKAVDVAEVLMRQQGVSTIDWGRLELVDGRWLPTDS
jgi:hypothetical protein